MSLLYSLHTSFIPIVSDKKDLKQLNSKLKMKTLNFNSNRIIDKLQLQIKLFSIKILQKIMMVIKQY